MKQSIERRAQFYFSLPRLVAKICGGDPRRAETNALEAWTGSLIFYLISYVFFAAQFIPTGLPRWQTALLLVAVAFFVWLFWLLLLYINSLIIKMLQLCGLFRTIPIRSKTHCTALQLTPHARLVDAWRSFVLVAGDRGEPGLRSRPGFEQ